MTARIAATILALLSLGASAAPLSALAGDARGEVVLLHGLGRSSRSMAPLAEPLRGAGFRVHNLDYASRSAAPEEILEEVTTSLERCCAASGLPLHFVTHSMGGIVVRALAEEAPPATLGRVVMLAPPNHGTEIVDRLGGSGFFRLVLGPSAEILGTDASSWPSRLPRPSFDFGVIAGRRSWNPVGSWLIPGEDDGTVSVESARLEGMRDFLVVDATHTWIMRDAEVTRQILHFLDNGRFRHDAP